MHRAIYSILFLAAISPSPARADAPRVTLAKARKAALAVVHGAIRSEELEREHGRLIYSFDIAVAGKPGIDEVEVDANTGAVLAHSHETPAQEAAEKKSEAAGR